MAGRFKSEQEKCLAYCRARPHGPRCQARKLPGRSRCRYHAGLSTGPRSEEGKATVTKNISNAFAKWGGTWEGWRASLTDAQWEEIKHKRHMGLARKAYAKQHNFDAKHLDWSRVPEADLLEALHAKRRQAEVDRSRHRLLKKMGLPIPEKGRED